MGFTFRKSLNLPGGFRINLSKSGVGASWGVPGLRIGTGPSGSRVRAYVPGTGFGWQSTVGSLASKLGIGEPKREPERAARRERRELDQRAGEAERMQERERAEHEVATFENQLALLTSLHKESGRAWNWPALAASPEPANPADVPRWQWLKKLAAGVVAGDPAAYEAAAEHLSPFDELKQLGEGVEVTAEHRQWALARFRANGREVIPSEALSLTKAGKLSKRKMPASRFWALYQDHVCSAVFRVARELFALLPVDFVFVHARAFLLDPATGHAEAPTVVSVAFDRPSFEKLNLDKIDPSDALERFPHEMRLTRSGFAKVDEITMDELVKATSGG